MPAEFVFSNLYSIVKFHPVVSSVRLFLCLMTDHPPTCLCVMSSRQLLSPDVPIIHLFCISFMCPHTLKVYEEFVTDGGCIVAQLRLAELASVGEQNEMIVERLRATERDLELSQHECSRLKV